MTVRSTTGASHDTTGARARWTVSLLACLAAFVVFLDATILNVGFRSVEASFPRTSAAGLALILTAYAVVLAAVLLPGGKLTDHLGPRRVFVAGFAGFALASLVCGVAVSAEMLIVARVFQAAAAACLAPASLALMLLQFPSEKRAHAVGIWSSAAGAAALAGPALGGALVHAAGWRVVFCVNVLPAAVAIGMRRALPDAPERGPAPDGLAMVFTSLAAGLLTGGLFCATRIGWSAAGTLACFGVAGASAVLCAMRGRTVGRPLIERALWTDRRVQLANAATLLTSAAGFSLMFVNMMFLTGTWGYSALTLGLALSPGPVMTALIAGPAGRLADRFGTATLAVPGAGLLAAGALWFALRTGLRPSWTATWLPGSLLTGTGIGLCFPALGASAIATEHRSTTGTAVALNGAVRQIGAVAGITAMVSIVGGADGSPAGLASLHWGWGAVAALALAGACVALALPFVSRTGVRATSERTRARRRAAPLRSPGAP